MPERAVILVRPGTKRSEERQIAACMQYAAKLPKPYSPEALAYRPEDAAAVVRWHHATVVIAAYDVVGDEEVEQLIADVGGRLEYTRPPRHRRPPPPQEASTEALVMAAFRRGLSPGHINTLLGVPLDRIKAIIDRVRTGGMCTAATMLTAAIEVLRHLD